MEAHHESYCFTLWLVNNDAIQHSKMPSVPSASREPIGKPRTTYPYALNKLNLTGAGVAVRAFTIHELIAEKLRAASATDTKAQPPPGCL